MFKVSKHISLITRFRRSVSRTLATTSEEIPPMHPDLSNLIQRNRIWAQRKQQSHPTLFPALAVAQSPKIMWIGCSDSRVPETEIFGAEPGDFFVHRNVANLVRSDDINLDAALEYAINSLRINHIIVCGHYGCGGVKAALDGCPLSSVNRWVLPLKNLLYEQPESKGLSEDQAWRHAVHANINRSCATLYNHPYLIPNRNSIKIHPWVYDISTGLVNQVPQLDSGHYNLSQLQAVNESQKL